VQRLLRRQPVANPALEDSGICLACLASLLLPGSRMARLLRFLPDDGPLVEVTTRTLQSRLLLTPTPETEVSCAGIQKVVYLP
jgi:hypothetical protein